MFVVVYQKASFVELNVVFVGNGVQASTVVCTSCLLLRKSQGQIKVLETYDVDTER